MRGREDVEAYLLRTGLSHESLGDDPMWLVHDRASGSEIVVRLVDDLVIFRVKVLELAPVTRREALFRDLLELNATDMVHGAYGITGDSVVLTCTLRIENLDYNEFQGTLDDFSVALGRDYPRLDAHRHG